jgi:hypothetical protein
MNTNMQIERFELKESEIVQIEKIYNVAMKVHEETPFDAAHDWNHHLAVGTNGLEIIDREKIQDKIDLSVFIAAAFFHDLERGSKGHDLAVLKMKEAGFNDEFVAKMVDLINEHSFGDTQKTLSGKVLWASDKIEYVSVERSKKSTKELPQEALDSYVKMWSERIVLVIEKFKNIGLPSAYEIFKRNFGELSEYLISSKPEYKHLIEGLKV